MPVLAVDLEYSHADRCSRPGEDSNWVILAIIQVSTHKSDYIFDCYNLREQIRSEGDLRQIFASPQIIKIMHGSDTDLKYLVADLNIVTVNLFDTARAFSFIQRLPDQTAVEAGIYQDKRHVLMRSLESLTNMFFGLELDKSFQVADWRIRPLMASMVEYARNDSHYLIALYSVLVRLMSKTVIAKTEIHLPTILLKQAKLDAIPWLQNIDDYPESFGTKIIAEFATQMQAFSLKK